MVDRAVAAGAKVECGGMPVEGPGYRFTPTVLTGAAQDSEIVQEEIFGPVIPVLRFGTFDEALALANDSAYGLASSIFTENYRLIERARHELLFGETYVNRFHFEAMQVCPKEQPNASYLGTSNSKVRLTLLTSGLPRRLAPVGARGRGWETRSHGVLQHQGRARAILRVTIHSDCTCAFQRQLV